MRGAGAGAGHMPARLGWVGCPPASAAVLPLAPRRRLRQPARPPTQPGWTLCVCVCAGTNQTAMATAGTRGASTTAACLYGARSTGPPLGALLPLLPAQACSPLVGPHGAQWCRLALPACLVPPCAVLCVRRGSAAAALACHRPQPWLRVWPWPVQAWRCGGSWHPPIQARDILHVRGSAPPRLLPCPPCQPATRPAMAAAAGGSPCACCPAPSRHPARRARLPRLRPCLQQEWTAPGHRLSQRDGAPAVPHHWAAQVGVVGWVGGWEGGEQSRHSGWQQPP